MGFFNLSKARMLFSTAAIVLWSLLPVVSMAALQSLDDSELSEISGQSLLNIDKYEYNTGAQVNNFYRVQMNSIVESSINIERLTLTDGAGNPEIDIENFSLNGGDTSNGNAAVSSATLTNPFVEFAFEGGFSGDTSDNRKFIGVRFGADNMNGFMSFGNQSDESGINYFKGYMETTALRGTVQTRDSAGGTSTSMPGSGRCCFNVDANVVIQDCGWLGCVTWASGSMNMPNTTMRFPSVQLGTTASPVTFLASGLEINTTSGPISQISVLTDIMNLPDVPFIAEGSGTANIGLTVNMDVTSDGTLQNLRAQTLFTEDLRYMHRAELDGNGFYLSFQNQAINWQGSPTNDTAQPGWWMSISKPLEFGSFQITDVVLPDSSLTEIADATSAYLQANPISLTLGDAIGGAITGSTEVSLGGLDLSAAAPINIPLTNQNLGPSQQEIRNCWNGSIGC